MTIKFQVKSNLEKNIKEVSALAGADTPFVIAKSLTDLAVRSKQLILQDVNKKFVKRRPSWFNAFKVRPATKTMQVSEVYNLAPFTEKHEKGGKRTPFRSKRLAVPLYTSVAALKTLRSRKNVRELLTKGKRGKKAFFIKSKSGNDLLVRRTSKKRTPLEVLYKFQQSAQYKKKLRMYEITQKVVRNFATPFFMRNLKSVLAEKQTLTYKG